MQRARYLFVGAAVYALVTIVVSGSVFALTEALPWLLLAFLVIDILAWSCAIVLMSRWIVRRMGERDIIVPVFACSIGTTVGTVALWVATSAPSRADLIHVALRPLTLGLITEPAGDAGRALSLGAFQFGFGIPWALFLIYAAVFFNTGVWSRRRQA